MNEPTSYRVEPASERVRFSPGDVLGYLIAVLFWTVILFFLLLLLISLVPALPAWLVPGHFSTAVWIVLVGVALAAGVRLVDAMDRWADLDEAKNTTRRVTTLYESSLRLMTDSRQLLRTARDSIDRAQQEYWGNAFGPFWEAVEAAARQLGDFDSVVQSLTGQTRQYHESLNGRTHNFPALESQLNSIPDPTNVIQELRRVVRLGQTNHKFAMIWEQRQTRKMLIAGFRTLDEALDNLGGSIERSISALEAAICSETARVADEIATTRRDIKTHARRQEAALDNIQRRRKPPL